MKTVREGIAYLRGLVEGKEFPHGDGKAIWDQVLQVLDGIADSLERLKQVTDEHEEYLDAIDGDLYEVEREMYGDEEGDDTDYVEVTCPGCGEELYVEEDALDDDKVEVCCPECGEVIHQGEKFAALEDALGEENRRAERERAGERADGAG